MSGGITCSLCGGERKGIAEGLFTRYIGLLVENVGGGVVSFYFPLLGVQTFFSLPETA